jgi:hypothetical protein
MCDHLTSEKAKSTALSVLKRITHPLLACKAIATLEESLRELPTGLSRYHDSTKN